MTDRDQFAMAAMQALVSYQPDGIPRDYASEAYRLADAMLEQSTDRGGSSPLTDAEISALNTAIVWMPPAYAAQHDAIRRILRRFS